VPYPPVEPAPTRWALPAAEDADEREICGVGADLEPGTILAAYRQGIFPMRVHGGPVAWWSPDPRGVIPLDGLHVSRSLRKSMRHFELRIDTSFEDVMRACGDPSRPEGWIDDSFVAAYRTLFDLGWVHSVEVWQDDELVGGLYGVAIGRLFSGESMFHRVTDASKAAMAYTVEILRDTGAELFDVQWVTPHLASMGAVEIPRREYVRRVAAAVSQPAGAWTESCT
jgi:leucyl/phenylalanyl-tRNA--protein transferase